ncbi:MAG: hypothetical protein LBP22_17460, partial [Deltaproteobacteria bacterium]|nr:hypothetical protein [Deltaproteobacteria bacterium]
MALLLIAQAEQPSNTAPMSLSGSAPDNEGSEQAYSDGPAVVPQVSESASGQPRSHEADSNVTIFNNEGLKPADSFGVTSAEGGQSGSSDINAASEQASNVTLTAAGDGPIISNENLTETGAAVPDGISAGSGQVATASGGGLTAPPDLIQAPRDPGDGGGQPLSAAVGMPAQPAG